MRAVRFKESTRSIGEPRDWDNELDGHCDVLDVLDHTDLQSGLNIMYSVWRPAPEEVAALVAGGVVRLGIFGTTHPVVNLTTLDPATCEKAGVEAMPED